MRDIHYQRISEIHTAYRKRKISPVEVTRQLLDRIERFDPELRAFVFVAGDLAIEEAKKAERELLFEGIDRGPLHGIPIALKDVCDTSDMPTAGGMPRLKNRVPAKDATVVQRLRCNGAILLGKLRMSEAATLAHHPEIRNPLNAWDRLLWTGGSSSGAGTAVAAGLCFVAVGSDTAGSILFPAACSNVVGLRPTWGRVSRHGILALGKTRDTVGPLARNARDAAILMKAIAGADPQDVTTVRDEVPDYERLIRGSLNGLSIGFDPDLIDQMENDDSRRRILEALDAFVDAGVEIRAIALPSLEDYSRRLAPLAAAETAAAHAHSFPLYRDEYGPVLRLRLDNAFEVRADQIAEAVATREELKSLISGLFQQVSLLLLPIFWGEIPSWERIKELEDSGGGNVLPPYCLISSACGLPAVAIPCGIGESLLPYGFQLVGKRLEEGLLLKACAAFEGRSQCDRRHPSI